MRDPAGYLAAVPYLVGFRPQRSLVAVGVDDQGDVAVTCRADLPAGAAVAEGAAAPACLPAGLATSIPSALGRAGASAALLSAHVDIDPGDGATTVASQLAAVARLLEAAGCPVLDAIHAGPTSWRATSCREPDCPAAGHPVTGLREHPVAASLVVAGVAPASGRGDVEPLPALPAEAAIVAARRSAAAWRESRSGRRRRRASTRSLLRTGLPLVRAWQRCHARGGPTPELAGVVAAASRDVPRLRDSLAVACLPAGRRGAAERLLRRDDTALDDALTDPTCAGAHAASAASWRLAASLADGLDRAAVEASHAWLCWAAGAGVAADVLSSRALERDPDLSLARLVRQCLERQLPPPWACRAAA